MHEFVRFEMLRREYLNQTFNFMPLVQEEYEMITDNGFFEEAQELITQKERYDRDDLSKYFNLIQYQKNFLFCVLDRTGEQNAVAATVDYFSQSLEYNTQVKKLVDNLAVDIEEFVQKELDRYNGHRTIPLSTIIVLGFMVPIIIYVTYLSTTSMFQ